MEDPARRVWDTALGQLQLQVTRPNYETWLKDTVGLAADNGSFTIGTPSDFVSEWLSAKMGPVIARTVGNIIGHDVTLSFQVIPPRGSDPEGAGWPNGNGNGHANGNGHNGDGASLANEDTATIAARPATPKGLHAGFTFERFIVGDSNRLAAAAALAAAERPGTAYNPLFIYGGSGLGKTHLLHAIAHRAAREGRRVVYTTCEQFTNEFVNTISQGRQEEFRRKYRGAEVLLVDDVQFLVGKDRTQEEFFHTFNDLHTNGCQLVITSDSTPRALSGLESRLSSRFKCGLIADIQPPDGETRLAILLAKAREQGIAIPPDVAQLLADRAQDSVRELEGFLNRVAAFAELTSSPITVDVATLALNALTPAAVSAPPAPDAIIGAVSRYFGISPSSLAGSSRARPIAEARHVAMYLLREDAQLPLKQIGRLLGNRDHSTVIHGCRKTSTFAETAKGRNLLAELRAQLS